METTSININKFNCELCNFKCNKLHNYNCHLSTAKHKNRTENTSKNINNYNCDLCNFKCIKKGDYKRHLKTTKHKNRTENTSNNVGFFICECGKEYKARNSLWYHKKKCNYKKNNALRELVKQNSELKELIINQNKQIIELLETQNC